MENKAEKLYGEGVHAFFDGNFWKAAEILKQAKTVGSEDPRPYFFLGLAYSRMGMEDEAKAMLKTASALEWEGRATRDFGVSDSLRRIQGIERLYVEAFRKKAKSNWEQAESKRQQERYSQGKGNDRSILRGMTKGAELPPPPKQESYVGSAPFGASSVNPFKGAEGADDQHAIREEGAALKPVPAADEKKTAEPKKEEKKADENDPFAAPAEPEKKVDEKKRPNRRRKKESGRKRSLRSAGRTGKEGRREENGRTEKGREKRREKSSR